MTEASEPPDTLLISLVGKDRPGVTSAIFQTLAEAGVEVLDIEQIVLRRRLILGVLVTAPRDWKRLRTKLQDTGAALGMTVDIDRGSGDNRQRLDGRSHVTVIGAPLKARAFAAVAGRIADFGANIDRIERMARYPVTAIDLHVSGADTATLRSVLSVEAATQGLDIAVQPANLSRHGMRLVMNNFMNRSAGSAIPPDKYPARGARAAIESLRQDQFRIVAGALSPLPQAGEETVPDASAANHRSP